MEIKSHYKFIIIGAGPSGLQAGYFLRENNQDFLIIDSGSKPGSFFEDHPRHRKLISINKVHTGYEDTEINLRWDWNSLLSNADEPFLFKKYTGKYFPDASKMVEYLGDFASEYSLPILFDTKVTNVTKKKLFSLTLSNREKITSDILIVATGLSLPWLPQIDGISECENYCDMSMDMDTYNDKRVLIIGKGNSAFETADALVEHASVIHLSSPNPIEMAWTTHYVGHIRAVNNNFLDTYQLKSQNAVLNADIGSIEKLGDGNFKVSFNYKDAENETEILFYDHVIVCTGFKFDTSIFNSGSIPEMCEREKLPVQNDEWESVNIPDLFFAGTIMQYRDYGKCMSGFIHGFRYNVKTLIDILLEKYMGKSLVKDTFPYNASVLTEKILTRINRTSALWQQPGFLVDAYICDENLNRFVVLEELYIENLHMRMHGDERLYFAVSLEFGAKKFDNPFNVSRIAKDNVMRSDESNFLHPIIRLYERGAILSEHHVIEDLEAEWMEKEHTEPLREYLERQLSESQMPFTDS